ncbi:MAG: hypothetical protein IJ604_14380 [Prevotella sp.]|nr:hypothetical protein [Prevotella sp.]
MPTPTNYRLSLFKASIEELIRCRIAPYIKKQEDSTGAEIHIETDVPCSLFRFKSFVKDLHPDADNVVRLTPGTYKLSFVSTQFTDIEYTQKYTLDSGVFYDFIEVSLKNQVVIRERKELEKRKELELEKRMAAPYH